MLRTPSEPALAYASAGPAAAPRVLFVMGFGMRGAVWEPQLADLRRDHAVAWFDNRGMGESAPGDHAFRMADLAADTLRVADALGWPDFHLTGVSLGGMVAQEVALAAPGRLRSLTLIATHAGGPLGLVPTATGLWHWVNAAFGPAAGRVDHLTRLLYPDAFLATVDREALQARMQLQVGTPPPRLTARRQLRAVIAHDTRARLAAITTPTLIVKPTADKLIRPHHSDRLAVGIPGARLLEVAGAGHGLTFHAAEAVNAALRAHYAAHDTPPRPAAP
jgi:pimeloyl-ACP methyl ester carboxylesterase